MARNPPTGYICLYNDEGGENLVNELHIPISENLPTGTVTFLFTDVEKSSPKWEQDPERMAAAMASHDDLADFIFAKNAGKILKPRNEGDSLFVVFSRAVDAVVAAVEFQRALMNQPWQSDFPTAVRIGIHTGEDSRLRNSDYYGPTVNRCARLRAVAHGKQILISQSTYLLVADRLPSDYGFLDHGSHRLKDLMRPERIRQIKAPGLPTDFPSLRSVDFNPNNLPLQLTSFIGRDQDLLRIKRLLENNRLVTLTGAGGTGKTRLSLQAGAEVADAFADGVWQVELAALSDPEHLPNAIVAAMRMEGDAAVGAVSQLRQAVADRSVLLILDNCEHQIKACSALVVDLLNHGPQLKILVTSREPLNIRGESVYRVPSLSLPPSGANLSVEEANTYDSIRLFADRAGEHDQEYQLRPESLPDVVELCRRLDGLPLALELAAAHTAYLSPRQILDRISVSLAQPAYEVGVDERHRSMTACIEWSFHTLDETEKNLFVRLACFIGGWTLEAAEAVCAMDVPTHTSVVQGLRNLVSKSLAISEESASGEKRFRFLEPIREYATSHITGEFHLFENEHFLWFKNYVLRSEAEMGTHRQGYWLHALDADIDNIRKALSSPEAGPEDITDMVITLNEFWNRRGLLRESRHWHEHAIRMGASGSKQKQVSLLNSLGSTAWKQGDLAAADRAFMRAMELIGEDDLALLCRTRNNRALLAAEAQRLSDAREAFRLNLADFTKLNQPLNIGTSLSNLGDIEVQMGNFEEAVDYLDRAILTFQELGNQAKVARASANQAFALARLDRYEEALHRFEESFTIWQTVIDWPFIGEALNDLAWVCHQRGDAENALRLIGASQNVLKSCGSSLSGAQQKVQTEALAAATHLVGKSRSRAVLERAKTYSPEPSVQLALDLTRMLMTPIIP